MTYLTCTNRLLEFYVAFFLAFKGVDNIFGALAPIYLAKLLEAVCSAYLGCS